MRIELSDNGEIVLDISEMAAYAKSSVRRLIAFDTCRFCPEPTEQAETLSCKMSFGGEDFLIKGVSDGALEYGGVKSVIKVRKVKKGLTKEECLELINGAGGVAILAHPNSLKKDYLELREEILYLKSLGLKGLETTHPNLNEEERRVYHEMAIEYKLLESGGTDFHGVKVKPDIEIGTGRNGNVYIPEDSLSLTKKVKSRY